jgi:hypothetical protein
MILRLSKAILTITVATFVFMACSDTTGPDVEEDAPEFQDTSPVTLDRSYYENADYGEGEEYENIFVADIMSSSVASIFSAYQGFGMTYFGMGNFDDASYDNGVWTWEETVYTMTVTLTAEETSEGVEWRMHFSGSDPETGESIEYTFLTGFIANDQSHGNWIYYEEDENPIFTYSWEAESDDNYTISFVVSDGEYEDQTISYEKNGNEHLIELSEGAGNVMTRIFWDTDSGTGYYMQNGEQNCWGPDFQNTPCS